MQHAGDVPFIPTQVSLLLSALFFVAMRLVSSTFLFVTINSIVFYFGSGKITVDVQP